MIRKLIILCAIISLNGCAGLFIAGAATTANLMTDTRTAKDIWQDNQNELDIASIGDQAAYKDKVRVVATSYDGNVVLMGQAPTQALSHSFEQQARQIKSIKNLYNEVKLKAPITMQQRNTDSWITTKVKSALLTDRQLSTIKIKVITEDSDVFLFGYVTSEQANKAADIARNIAGVKRVIKAFQYGQAKH